jgi:hypothetical protein
MSAPIDHGTYVLSDAAQAYVTFRPTGDIVLLFGEADLGVRIILDPDEVERLRVLLNERAAQRRDVP